ncbi:MAG: TetR/AcrR family transcriptional regulator, partial [Asticcacaulis sp.]
MARSKDTLSVVADSDAGEPPLKSARRGRPPKTTEGGEARDMILDVAEELFAMHGFHGVTIRQVAREAGFDTALIHYYFGAKRSLFDAVFLRRAEVLNRDRMEALNSYALKEGPNMTVEGLIGAFVLPVMRWQAEGGIGWKHYCALVSQVNATPMWGGETMTRYFDPLIHRLIELLQVILPEATKSDLYWAYHNLSGALTLTMGETGRVDRLSGGLCRSGDLTTAGAMMIRFAS